jgi:Fe2+ transport system protein FeoA
MRHEASDGLSLADIPPGGQAEFVGFSNDFPADRKAYLQAYGLVVNHQIQVVQHSPVTIIRLDNLELALENDLARGIRVQFPVTETPGAE